MIFSRARDVILLAEGYPWDKRIDIYVFLFVFEILVASNILVDLAAASP